MEALLEPAKQEEANLPRLLDQAIALHQKGELAEAERLYQEILEARPGHFDALHLLGIVRHQQGRHAEALALIGSALERNPCSAEAHSNYGSVLDCLGRHEEALASYDQALEIRPEDARALYNRGNVLKGLGRLEEALASYDRALALRPNHAETLSNRGIVLRQLNRLEEALASYDEALALRPDYAEALNNRGNVLRQLERFEEALASYDRALTLRPDYAEALNGRGNALVELKRPDEALASYDKAISFKPDYPDAPNSRGNALLELNRFDEALASYDKAIALKPDYPEALNNGGTALLELRRVEEALASYDKAIALKPDYADAFSNRGNALKELNRLDEALASYDRAVQLDPEHGDHRFNRSLLLLLHSSFGEGWREYEWRRKRKTWVERGFKGPEWAGETVSGKRVLLYGEQGLGDTIQFARFARSAALSGATVILDVDARLAALLQRLDGEARVVRAGDQLPEFDLHLPLMSVPFVLGLSPERIPAEVPYLSADPVRVDRWSSRLPASGFRVGVSWQGNPTSPVGKGRSIPLVAFAPLGRIPGVRLISLQKEAGVEQLADLPPEMVVETLGSEFDAGPDAFPDTAAVVMNLDLIVTCDTAVAHLAGALGRPVWIVLKQVPDWRWMIDREDSPWYPTARLFRQRRAGDWDDVFARVAAELSHAAANSRSHPLPRRPPASRREPRKAAAPLRGREPADPSRLLQQALAVHQEGKPAEAERLYLKILEVQPDHFDALHLLGVIRYQQGRDAEALELIGSALKTNPRSAAALSNRGLVLHRLGRHEGALASYDSALAIIPDHAGALNNRGNVLLHLNRFEEALTSYNGALAIREDLAEALNGRGTALVELKRFDEGLASFDRALAIRPDYSDAQNGRGNALLGSDRPDEALASYDRALAVRPDYAEAASNRGAALRELKRFEEALGSYDRALALRPDYADALNNRGRALWDLRRLDEAVACYDKAIAINPDDADAKLARSHCRLLQGDFSRGWAGYEQRWLYKGATSRRHETHPLWLGAEELSGRYVLLHAEQGLGDAIQFARYVPLVKQRGARVLLEVQPPLKALMGTLPFGVEVFAQGEALPPFDFQCPLLSLPLAFNTVEKTIPWPGVYLSAEDGRLHRWQERLGEKTQLRVGVVWSGNISHKNDRNRSIALETMGELFTLPVDWVCLQKEIRPADRAVLPRFKRLRQFAVLDAGPDAFLDTAAIIACCDLVISVDTSVAHLAGAMSKPVWVLLPYTPDWRWLLDREDNPWYPTARLFRQQQIGGWAGVMRRVSAELHSVMARFDPAIHALAPHVFPVSVGARNKSGHDDGADPSEVLDQAIAFHQERRLAEAERLYLQIMDRQPDQFDAAHLLGVIRHQQGRHVEALELISSALKRNPRSADALANQGLVLQHLGRDGEALASCDRALAIKPDHAKALNNRGIALCELRRFEEALASYDQALAVRPDYAEALSNRGNTLFELRRLDEAQANYDEAIAIAPEYADPKFHRSLCHLLLGEFSQGWQGYEQRWLRNEAKARRHETHPLWLGAEELSGRTILLHAEQGLGDTIQFVRYADLVKGRRARVVLEVQEPLKELMRTLPVAVDVFARGEPLPGFDLQCPLLSLPLAFNTTEPTTPWTGPYLSAEDGRSRRWQERLGEKVLPRVGVVWSGSPTPFSNRKRSIALETMAELSGLPVEWVCLQKEIRESDRAVLPHFARLREFADEIGDFADTAALVACCDLVISVDTAVAHLAGAMGKPVWILLPYAPDWRWLLDREDSPWYPTVRLVRQQRPGDWSDVIRSVCEQLRASGNKEAMSGRAIQKDVDISPLLDQAVALHHRGALAEAERLYLAILDAQPDHFDALHLLGVLRSQQGRNADALDLIAAALKKNPGSADALSNYGLALRRLNRHEEALASYDRAMAIRPDHAEALNNRGNILLDLKRFEEALASYDRALAIRSDHVEALSNRGNALSQLKRFEEALTSYGRALAIRPDYVEAHNGRGYVLWRMKRFEEAVASYDRALAIQPDDPDALNNRADSLRELARLEEAVESYDRALAIKPDHRHALRGVADLVLTTCDWTRTAKFAEELEVLVAEQKSNITPFTLLGYCDDPALHLQCARNYIREKVAVEPLPLGSGAVWRHERMRIAYLSADFHGHATAHLMAGLFELHDRSRFEVVGLSFGPEDHSRMRARLVGAFDQFHDVRSKSDLEAANLLTELEIDIAVDLKGYTQNSRPGILAHRPAPIQVSYLGYPGTMGAEFIDYVIADPVVLPFDQQPFYAEKIVHLPECYQANDSKRKIAERPPTRGEAGLPDQGFVFCCFNNNYKITAPVFDVWMRLLVGVENSVLWLLRDNEPAERNLRREAVARGVDPARLVFADRAPVEDHLARHCLADLFLDTLPVNAHTTASDALWVGLPVLTCRGNAFGGQVAASLLGSIGLPELVTGSLEAYEGLALRLARDASLLGGLRQKLERNRLTQPLFDTDRFRRHIEAAYTTMWELWQRGERPRSFRVAPDHAKAVMPGLDPGIRALARAPHVDRRVKPGDDDEEIGMTFAAELADPAAAKREKADPPRVRDQAVALHRHGKLPKKTGSAKARVDRGIALGAQSRHQEALASFDAALSIDPDCAEAHCCRGNALTNLGRDDEALRSYDRALALRSDYAEALGNRGNLLQKLKRFEEAFESFDRALTLRPDDTAALYNRGNALLQLKRFEESLASYDQALALRPNWADVLVNRGNALLELKRLDAALASFDRALAIGPDHAEALNNRGIVLRELDRLEEAVASYDRALAIRPDYRDAHNNRGNALRELKRLDEALASYDRAIQLDPEHGEHRFNRSLLLLLIGSFGDGWREYEWRRKRKAWVERGFKGPEWAGEAVSGKCVLLYGEQGLGDTIQFVRYAQTVKRRGARVLLGVQAPLTALMATLPFGVEILTQGETLPEFDFHCPLMSLPLVFNPVEATVPWTGAYLGAEEGRLRQWQNRLGEKAQLRVGIVWSGSITHTNDRNRSIALETIGELFKVPIEWVCLQKEIRPADRVVLPRFERLRQFAEEIGDFADTAALVACCDLVVSVDTSVAHLAGAMGKPVWILLPYTPDWRWLVDREDSPWYPTARLFRQHRFGDWRSVIDAVCEELRALEVTARGEEILRSEQTQTAVAKQEKAGLARLLDQAIFVHQRGRLTEAERLYLNILEAQPDHFDALHFLGIVRHQQGRDAEALELIGSALTRNPHSAEALSHHGSVLDRLGRHGDALGSYDQALAIRPDDAQTLYNRGNVLNGLGRLDEALASYDQALALRPGYAEALSNRGIVLRRLNRIEEALASYDRALALRPNYPEALNNRGNVLRQLGRFEEALASYDQALALGPDYTDAFIGRGNTLLELKRFEEALASYDNAIAQRPNYPEALNSRGNTLVQLQRLDEALESYDRAVAIRPDYAEALHNRGIVLWQLKRFEEALASYDRALAVRPDYAEALSNRGVALGELGRFDEALASYHRALALRPDYAEAFSNLGIALWELGRFEEAVESYDRASAIRPDYADALSNRGVALGELKRFDEALASYDRALEIRPDYPDALNNRGNALKELRRFDEALASYDRALQLDPGHAEHRFNRSGLLLVLGSFSEGWRDYEARKRRKDWLDRKFNRPEWTGEDVSGKCLLLYGEQGFGDAIQFARYADLVKRRGPRVLLEVHAPLKALMRTLPFGVEAFALSGALPEFDYHCPLLSLPLVFNTTEKTIPWPGAYLSAEESRLRRWQRRLGEKAQLRVGVVWSGSTAHKNDRNRSIALEKMGELFTLPVDWVCLQKEIRPADQADLSRFERLRQFAERIGDFADTAALVACCDLVISVDTSVAHLAGAMGKPVWILLPYTPDWRWLLDREDSPWYPTARLFRQRRFDDWPGVIRRVREELRALTVTLQSAEISHLEQPRAAIPEREEAGLSELFDQAAAFQRKGSLADAESLYLAILERQPDHFDALHFLGALRLHQGRNAEALELIGSAVARNPRSADVLSTRGLVLYRLQRYEEALASYDQALALKPDDAEVLGNRGNALWELKRFEEALASYGRALAIRPDYPETLNNRGTVLLELKRFEEALASYDRALDFRPDYAEALSNRSVALGKLKRFEEALTSCERALAIRPDYVEALNNCSNVLRALKRFDEALARCDRALAIRPDCPETLNNRGNTLGELKRFEEAQQTYDQALAIRPDYAEALYNRGNVLQELNRVEEALASYDRALAVKPGYANALNNRGNALMGLNRLNEALENYDRALQLDPENGQHRANRSLLLLLLGSFGDGWREYEWRRKTDDWVDRKFQRPEWTGENLSGKRVLLYGEQGLGDTIQFARFARSVAMSGAEVILEVQASLGSLIRRLAGEATIVKRGEKLPDFDLHLPLMSVPFILGLTPERISAEIPYLSADPLRVDHWSGRLPTAEFRVGIAWQGNPAVRADKGRSIPLRAFASLSGVPGVKLISLQKEAGVEQLADLPAGMAVGTLGTEFDAGPDAFLDTAAVMMNLDLIVTCDTAVAHLAGALGCPVWIVLKHVPDWRWMIDREASPWYPTARLFRQSRAGDWDEVFARVTAELARVTKKSRGRSIQQQPDLSANGGTIFAPLSFGELIDKITILSIKAERILDPGKTANVRRELEALTTARRGSPCDSHEIRGVEGELKRINEELWDIEDRIRDCERQGDFGSVFIDLARAVYKTNDRRAALKRRINELAGSALFEEKSYHPQSEADLRSSSPSLTRHPVEAMSNRSIGEGLIDGRVIFEWQISSYFGWGVYGLNLLLSWWRVQGPSLLTSVEFNESDLTLNALEKERLQPALEQSRAFQAWLRTLGGGGFDAPVPVLHGLGNDLIRVRAAHLVELSGKPSLGVIFCESTEFSRDARERAKAYELLIAGSTWNREILEQAGLGPGVVVLQGVDPSRFHPGPRAGRFADRFTVFSGGKLELRKSQDLVLLAFRIFARRHPEALLVTAWSSPWPQLARSVEANPAIKPVCFRPDGKVDAKAWAAANGIADQQVLDLGAVPNAELPRLYREMDVALFANRCEGGTNLVAMECMACGVPLVISRNTGHLDLIAPDRCIPLGRQSPLAGADHLGWGESDIEEIVEALETVWRDRAAARARGSRGAEFMRRLTWDETARRLADVIEPYRAARRQDAALPWGRSIEVPLSGSPKTPVRDWSRFDAFLSRLAEDVYPEPAQEPHITITSTTIEALQQEGLIGPGLRVLDIGCGQGGALEHFQRFGLQATGITLGSDFEVCRDRGLDVRQMDQNFMDFADGEFDLLWCRHVLEHSVAPLFTLTEYRRVTKPGGLVYVEVPAPDTSARHEANPNHYSVFSQSSWLSLFQRAGFTVERSAELTFAVPCGPDIYWAFLLRNG